MDIFITGGSGYIGRPTIEALVRAGHRVSALARSEASAGVVRVLGAEAVHGDLTSLETLRERAARADATINLAQDNAGDTAALTAAASEALQAGAHRYLHTGGTWAYGDASSDDAPFDPPPFLAWFVEIVSRVVARGGVALMPGIVYGRGGGILGPLMGARYIGDGSNHMPLLHVDDLADLYVRALEAPAGAVYIAAGEGTPTMREVAESMGAARSVTLEEFGPFGEAFALDQRFTSRRARVELGWAPREFAPAGLGTAQ
jgi:nucleoside-diphosphate-sugar epimerase